MITTFQTVYADPHRLGCCCPECLACQYITGIVCQNALPISSNIHCKYRNLTFNWFTFVDVLYVTCSTLKAIHITSFLTITSTVLCVIRLYNSIIVMVTAIIMSLLCNICNIKVSANLCILIYSHFSFKVTYSLFFGLPTIQRLLSKLRQTKS